MSNTKFHQIVNLVKSLYPNKDFIPLHEPKFIGNEKKFVIDAIDSTFVSSVGAYVDLFEKQMAIAAGTKYAVATVNGTSALHMCLLLDGVNSEDEVITQALTFIATSNAISYIGSKPIFIDIDEDTLGLSPKKLRSFLEKNAEKRDDGFTYNKSSQKRIKSCVPMHTFGLPCRIDEIVEICSDWNITVIEDSAESIGSYYKGKPTGSFGKMGAFSFNGNKIITSGGGGAIVTNHEDIAKLAKHLTTQAKIAHRWEFKHDLVGFNYRMPNINAALLCAQLENLETFIKNKRELASIYKENFDAIGKVFIQEIENAQSNYWLNVIKFENRTERDEFLEFSNNSGVMTRPCWTLMNKLSMFSACENDGLELSNYMEDRLVNIPSSVR